jgi:hypothetical protein
MSSAAQEREKGWRSDVDFLLQAMQQQHYIYKSRSLPNELQEQAAKLKAEVPRVSDERMLVELQRLMVYLGDGHCYVLPWSGAICSISSRYHESIPGDQRVWIEPALKVELSSKDYFANHDPVLETVLRAAGK